MCSGFCEDVFRIRARSLLREIEYVGCFRERVALCNLQGQRRFRRTELEKIDEALDGRRVFQMSVAQECNDHGRVLVGTCRIGRYASHQHRELSLFRETQCSGIRGRRNVGFFHGLRKDVFEFTVDGAILRAQASALHTDAVVALQDARCRAIGANDAAGSVDQQYADGKAAQRIFVDITFEARTVERCIDSER